MVLSLYEFSDVSSALRVKERPVHLAVFIGFLATVDCFMLIKVQIMTKDFSLFLCIP